MLDTLCKDIFLAVVLKSKMCVHERPLMCMHVFLHSVCKSTQVFEWVPTLLYD